MTALNIAITSGMIGLIFAAHVAAIDSIDLSVQTISADNWVLHNSKLTLHHLNQASPQISLVAASLSLPPPFDKIQLINIHCQQFYWQENYLNCAQGTGDMVGEVFPDITFSFALKVQGEQGSLLIKQLSLFSSIRLKPSPFRRTDLSQMLYSRNGLSLWQSYSLQHRISFCLGNKI